MKKIHFLAIRQDGIIDYLLAPVRYNQKALKERGFDISFFYKPSDTCLQCDILCLLSKAVMPMLHDQNTYLQPDGPVIQFIQKARQFTNKIIWFDTSDSTSVTHFELLPYVDFYLKKQLLKDLTLYQKPFYGGRIFTDFYHQHFNITDDVPFDQFHPLSPEDMHKVGLSWNIGLGNLIQSGTRKAYYKRFFADYLPISYAVDFHQTTNKTIDIFLSTSANLKRTSVAFHRQELVRRLRDIQQKHQLSGAINGPRLPDEAFRQTMSATKIMPSPFGWGELGLRDYEAFIYGATLLKPSMNHMTTWPNIFIENETYQPFQWDFSDLEEHIQNLLSSPSKQVALAQNGQDIYRQSISKQGMAQFCDWFIQHL
jgi:hypothetical protein